MFYKTKSEMYPRHKEPDVKKMPFKPFLRACGPLRGGGSESESDLEPDWDSEPDRAGRGFSSSESLSAIFFSDPDPESESEFDEAFCTRTDKMGFRKITSLKSHKMNCRKADGSPSSSLSLQLSLPLALQISSPAWNPVDEGV